MSVTSDFWKVMNSSGSSSSSSKSSGSNNKGSSATGTSSSSKKKKKNSVSDDFLSALGGDDRVDRYIRTADDDDIGPVASNEKKNSTKKEKDEDRNKWFQKGLFDDGYDFGDITKTILGTGADVLEDIGAGIAEMPEKIADAAMTLAPYYQKGQLYQAAYSGGDLNATTVVIDQELQKLAHEFDMEQAQKEADEFIKKDWYDGKAVAHSILNPVTDAASAMIGQDYEEASVLGEKADSTVQSGGQLLATIGLQAVGVPWFLTTGVTAYGAEAENALNQGATHEEAMGSAAISAAAEVLTEKLSGGIKFGGKALDDALTQRIARGISNKIGRTALRLGLDFAGEAGEELISEIAGNVGSALYRLDEESWKEILLSEEAMEGYLDAMIGGGMLGSVSGGFKAANAARNGVDYVTELTKNEQAVVDKVYKERLEEQEKKGKLTEKQKDKLYERVLEDMDKGYITTDEIESALGGGTYNLYKSTVDSEDAILKEYDELGQKTNATLADQARYTELTQQVKNIREKSQRNALKSQLGQEVSELVKGDRLIESYKERTRRTQAYQADLTKYDAKQQTVIQKAIDSGILNNSNRTHEFVDMVAKISADKGVLFDFTNNAKLKDSGFAVDGKQVNGYVTKDGITLNIDSAKAMESTVGHEITHVLEGTEFYDSLKQTLFEYAKTKGEYQTRYDSLAELYKDVKDADIEGELAADLVGDYLFQDTDFINNLSTQNRNVFQKIYDEIKYLCKVATAGSKEARELERVKKAFDKAYREGNKAQTETKYSVSETTDGRFAAVVDNDILSNIDTTTWDKTTKDAAKKAASEALKQFSDGIVVDGITRKVNKVSRREYTRSNYTESLYNQDPDVFADKMRAAEVADDIVVVATNWQRDGGLKHPRTDNFVDFDHGNTLIVSGNAKYSAEVVVGITDTGEAVLYDVVDMTPTAFDIKKEESPTTATTQNAIGDIQGNSFDDSVAQKGENVNYSLNELTDDGLTMTYVRVPNQNTQYYGSTYGQNIEPAGEYMSMDTMEGKNKIDGYEYGTIQFKKPLVLEHINTSDTGWKKTVSDMYGGLTGKKLTKALIKDGYDAIVTYDDYGYNEIVNLNGTKLSDQKNGDVKYSLSDSDGKKLTKEQQEYFKDSKMRDEEGNLKVMYHGSQDAGFHVFDASMSDDNTSFFFVDRNDVAASYSGTTETYEAKTIRSVADMNNFLAEIGYDHYEAVERNGKIELLENNEHVATKDTAQEIYEEFCWYEGVGDGDANYKVYLNLKNPLEVDAQGRNWNNVSREYSQEIADRYQSLTAAEKASLTDAAEWGEISIFRDAKNNPPDAVTESAFEKIGDVNIYDLFTIAEDNFSEESIKQFAVKQMNTRDYAQKAKEQGYDGVIFKNIVDVGEYGGDYSPATVAIAFESNQIKSVANEKPSGDPDIRFSLSKSVEETKDLVALHNLTADKLSKSLELGGLPMPSLAITKADIPHSNFGEITLVFGRETIDPKKNKKNKVYSADAWTPTFPRVEYEADSKVANKISQKLRELEGKVDDYFHRDLRRVNHGFEDYLNSQGGEEGLIQRVMDNYGMKAAYLEDIGKHIEKVTKLEEVKKDYNPDAADKYMEILDILGVSTAEEVGQYNLKEARDNHGEELEAVYPGVTKSAMRMSRIFSAVMSYLENKDSGPVYNTVTDSNATQKAVDDALDAEGYEAWVRNLFSGIVKDSGIYNNKEYYTPSGNRRSFKQTHLPFTLENIVKAMASQNDGNAKNVSGFNGIKTLRAATAETFKSVDEMHQRKGRLQNRTQEEADALNDALQSRLFKVMEAIDNESGQSGERNPYIRLDTIGEIIAEIGEGGKYSVTDIQRIFKQYGKNVSDDTALDVKQLLYDVTQMPVNIFEAKPQRVVSFDEAKAFVIPNNADVKLKQELLNRGYSIAEYDPKVEGDRQRVVNQFEEYKFSLSNVGEEPVSSYRATLGKDIALQTEDIAPTAEDSTVVEKDATTETVPDMETVDAPVTAEDMRELFPDEGDTPQVELDNLRSQNEELENRMYEMSETGDFTDLAEVNDEWMAVQARMQVLEAELAESESDRIGSIDDADAPPEMDAPMAMPSENYNPFSDIGLHEITRSTRSFSDQNPGARRFIEEAALGFLYDVNNSTRGERWYNDQLYYDSGGEQGFGGTSRQTTADIADLKDTYGYTWDALRRAAEEVADGNFRSLAAKRIEYLLNTRLMEGYTDVDGRRYEPNQDYISFLNESQANEQAQAQFDSFMETADMYDPEDIAPVAPVKPLKEATPDTMQTPIFESKDKGVLKGQTTMFEDKRSPGKTAKVLTEEPKINKKSSKIWAMVKEHLLDNGMVFEDLSKQTGNRALEGKWNFIRYAQARAQRLIGNGTDGVTALKDIKKEVEQSGKTEQFYDYLYHKHNVDRMNLEDRFDNVENKPVFGYAVTSETSQRIAAQYERTNPEFKRYANEVYNYMNHLRSLLVENGVISKETAALWAKMYPHYVPIRRAGQDGLNISVPLDTRKTGVNNPVKRATGGNQDILPLFDTMAQRTIQTYRAISRNSFGIELKNTLGSVVGQDVQDVDSVIDSIDNEEALLKPGVNGENPTFTVFENGERVEFEITEEMFNALKPKSEALAYRNKILSGASSVFRGLTTQYSIPFMATNAIKDAQDVLINSQHPIQTYANFPRAQMQQLTNGKWYQEYIENGGEDNTYFDNETNVFQEDSALMKAVKLPLNAISTANNFIELTPRLAEYIASREAGRSIEVAMLDAARVTTNFAAGGDLTKFLNANGATFLNASVQGAIQQARNIREAHHKGLAGYLGLAARFAVAGLPAILLNNLMWDDDEEYEELADYVKQDYYVVGKYDDGKFIRIPKGRTVAVIQNAIEQVQNALTGDDEVDLGSFLELAINNLAPNNPLENNIFAPIKQVLTNKTWYGEDLVPSRLQDLPAAEQYDEKTDTLSRKLGEALDISPYKINYLLNQYSGGIGDVVLPMMTPKAEHGDDSFWGNITAPLKDKFTTDSVINSQVVSDFYDKQDELAVLANSKNATTEDMFRDKYMDSVGWEMSDLYKQKREIQNSDLPDSEKYEQTRELQQQIVDRMREALASYDDIHVDGKYAEVGGLRFNYDEGKDKWYEISEGYYYDKEQEVTQAFGISYSDYWNNRESYDDAYWFATSYGKKLTETAKTVFGASSFATYASNLSEMKADKDEEGNSINGSKKKKVQDYIYGLDIPDAEKHILFRSQYNSFDDGNREIIEYLLGRDDISYDQMNEICVELGFDVDFDSGMIYWD